MPNLIACRNVACPGRIRIAEERSRCAMAALGAPNADVDDAHNAVHVRKAPAMLHTRLRRAVPLGAAALAATAIAAPAYGAAGVAAPGGEVIYNTAAITLSTFPVGATPITVSRDGTAIANAVANVDGTGLA